MAGRAFDRAFNDAQARERAAEEAALAAQPKKRIEADAEEQLRKVAAPMSAMDAIDRILLAWKDKDYFRLLQLPRPEADALGRPAWEGVPGDVSKSYRRLSILVHPDKFASEPEMQKHAREAFEALNEARRMLQDPGQFEKILAKEADAARARQQQREAEATLEERVLLNAQQKEAARDLKRKEGEAFQAEMQRQLRLRQEAAKRKQQASRYRRDSDDENGAGSDDEEENRKQAEAAAAAAKRKAEQEADDDEEEATKRRRRNNAANRRRKPG